MSSSADDQVRSQEQTDSPPIYPPPSRDDADSASVDDEREARVQRETRVADREIPQRPVGDAPADSGSGAQTALFERRDLDTFNRRWSEVQGSFVDEPRRAVEQADALVSDVIKEIVDSFGKQRAQLEAQWGRGGDVSTEDLRQIFQRYRSFFSRLLEL